MRFGFSIVDAPSFFRRPQQKVQANDLAGRLGQLCVGTFTEAAMHTPVAITEQAVAVARERQADCTVALGGGSTTGLGKSNCASDRSPSNRRADDLCGFRSDADPG
jgi:alcohol dehydrogenase class IV